MDEALWCYNWMGLGWKCQGGVNYRVPNTVLKR